MKISLITVSFNSAATIATAMESVLRQKGVDYEYIVVDGASRDNTLEVIRAYEPKFAGRMTWISEPDRGMYDAINKGIRRATGDVIGILNTDDVLSSDDVFAQVAAAFDAEVDAVYANIRFLKGDAQDLSALRALPTKRFYSSKHWQPWKLQWGYMPPHPSLYIRKEFFAQLGGYALDYKIAADYELIVRYLRKNRLRTRYLNQTLVDMRMGGLSTKNWKSNLLLNREIVRGNRANGYFCSLPMMLPKYFYKVWEFIIPYFADIR